jgi:AraC-like DNA-binding protein
MAGLNDVTMRTRDLDEAIATVTNVYCPHQVSVTGRALGIDAALDVAGSAAQPLVRLSYSAPVVIDAGDFPNLFLIMNCARGSASVRQGSRSAAWCRGQTVPLSAGIGTDLQFDGMFCQNGVRLDPERLERLCASWLGRPLDRPLRFALQPFSPTLEQTWSGILQFLRSSSAAMPALGPVAAASLDDFILTAVLQGHPHSFSEDLAAPASAIVPGLIRRAERFMAENAGSPISIADIAAEVGASVRALQAGFREWRQSTPMTELRRIRLQRVREALLEPDETTEVTDVALRWGFVHLGRFSAAYKTAFGEAPGITLRRRRPRARDRDENWTATPIRRR